MFTLKFIFKKAADKFVSDVESDLHKYKRILEKSSSPKAKKTLALVNQKLGIKTTKSEKVIEVSDRDWKKERETKARLIKEEAKKAISEHFESDF